MFRKSFISFLFIAALVSVFESDASAQDPIRGVVELKKADGTMERIDGAQIDLYRIDIKGGGPSGKTNKKGEFNFVGLLFGGEYAMAVSCSTCQPVIETGIKAGQENIKIWLNPGDGRKWTEAEVRKAVSEAPRSGGEVELTAEQKEALAEREKEIDEHNAKVIKAQETNRTIQALVNEGVEALKVKNYDVAVAKFDEGYRAEPNFAGSAPVLLRNKGEALRQRGVDTFNSSTKLTGADRNAALQKARDDYKEAASAYETALGILEKAGADPEFKASRLTTLQHYVELQGPFAVAAADPVKTAEATAILDKYIAAEPSDEKEMPVIMNWAKLMAQAGESKNAVHAYRYLQGKKPDDVDVMLGLGSALWVEGLAVDPPNEAQIQEGVNLLQKFVDTAPDTHPSKTNAKETIASLKETTNVTPKKTAPAKKRN